MKPKNNTTMILIIVLVVLALAFAGYVYYQQTHQRFNPGRNNPGNFTGMNFQLNDSQIAEVTSFFDSNPDNNAVTDYCQKNRVNCVYYCRTINSNDAICPQIMNFFSKGGQTATMNSVIQLEDVWKRYEMGKSGGLTVLKEINFEIKKGEFVAIAGPSGSGKSTIMHLIGALDIPSYGNVYLKGKNIKKMSKTSLATLRGKTIGFIFQQFNLLPTFSALENVMLPMELIDIPDTESKTRAEKLLSMLGLQERLHHKPTELSGGQQQRVAIARALANDPEVIIADEPTGNLDSKTGLFVMDFLSAMNKEGKTIIIVTHELDLVSYASRVIYIKDGMIEKEVFNKKSRTKNEN